MHGRSAAYSGHKRSRNNTNLNNTNALSNHVQHRHKTLSPDELYAREQMRVDELYEKFYVFQLDTWLNAQELMRKRYTIQNNTFLSLTFGHLWPHYTQNKEEMNQYKIYLALIQVALCTWRKTILDFTPKTISTSLVYLIHEQLSTVEKCILALKESNLAIDPTDSLVLFESSWVTIKLEMKPYKIVTTFHHLQTKSDLKTALYAVLSPRGWRSWMSHNAPHIRGHQNATCCCIIPTPLRKLFKHWIMINSNGMHVTKNQLIILPITNIKDMKNNNNNNQSMLVDIFTRVDVQHLLVDWIEAPFQHITESCGIKYDDIKQLNTTTYTKFVLYHDLNDKNKKINIHLQSTINGHIILSIQSNYPSTLSDISRFNLVLANWLHMNIVLEDNVYLIRLSRYMDNSMQVVSNLLWYCKCKPLSRVDDSFFEIDTPFTFHSTIVNVNTPQYKNVTGKDLLNQDDKDIHEKDQDGVNISLNTTFDKSFVDKIEYKIRNNLSSSSSSYYTLFESALLIVRLQFYNDSKVDVCISFNDNILKRKTPTISTKHETLKYLQQLVSGDWQSFSIDPILFKSLPELFTSIPPWIYTIIEQLFHKYPIFTDNMCLQMDTQDEFFISQAEIGKTFSECTEKAPIDNLRAAAIVIAAIYNLRHTESNLESHDLSGFETYFTQDDQNLLTQSMFQKTSTESLVKKLENDHASYDVYLNTNESTLLEFETLHKKSKQSNKFQTAVTIKFVVNEQALVTISDWVKLKHFPSLHVFLLLTTGDIFKRNFMLQDIMLIKFLYVILTIVCKFNRKIDAEVNTEVMPMDLVGESDED